MVLVNQEREREADRLKAEPRTVSKSRPTAAVIRKLSKLGIGIEGDAGSTFAAEPIKVIDDPTGLALPDEWAKFGQGGFGYALEASKIAEQARFELVAYAGN